MTETAKQAADEAWQKPDLLAEPMRRRMQPYSFGELEKLPKRTPLIKGLLDRGGMSVVYGDSNCGKTFLAIDICLHIALGRSWCRLKVQRGRALYVAAEGGLGIYERLRAFQNHKGIMGPPLHVIPATVDFRSAQRDVDEIISEVKLLGGVEIIVIDTLARAISGGDENSSMDMGAFIRCIDRLRQATGAHVMIIHHTGKIEARGARGHSSLRAATDTEIAVTKSKESIVELEVTKQRDGRIGGKLSFTLEVVSLGRDEDGENITSCVLLPMTITDVSKNTLPSRGNKQRALSVLDNVLAESGELGVPNRGMPSVRFVREADFRKALEQANISSSDKPDNVRRQIDRIISSLNDDGITATYDDKIWLVGQVGQLSRTEVRFLSGHQAGQDKTQ
ncbi:MAG: AAA family ATPase [Alphaproteobacteria bacterium]|nr:AAA family ATPase [Alphaproteobacteria bacterium]